MSQVDLGPPNSNKARYEFSLIRGHGSIWDWCLIASFALVLASVPVGQLFSQSTAPRSQALSPAQSLASLQLESAFEATILAHEPQVIDPVDAAFDDRGRLWVVEMRDYPYPTNASPSGCVRVLSDADNDGHYETSNIFADQLDMPTGLALWKDGAVITLAGQVVWFRDTDGDLKSDTQQVWIEGFTRENEQLRANHPRLGPDGWWYIASGLRGGNVIAGPDFRNKDAAPISLGSRDVRFRPHTKQLETITGPAQFGLCFDTVGNRLFCSNRNPAVMVRFEQEDLVGNPLAGLIPSVVDLIPAGEQSHVYPLVNAWTTSNLHSGQFTAACGVFFHEFPGEFCPSTTADEEPLPALRVFACEPTGSLVHSTVFRETLSEQNAVRPTSVQSDWLASSDAWFRPVNIALAPDGGILVADMHRAVIEHPQWVPDELKKRPDERWGNDRGRIFHISLKRQGTTFKRMQQYLHDQPLRERSNSSLVQLIASANPWMRETARRLLIERGATEQIAILKAHAKDQSWASANRVAALQLAAVLIDQLPTQESDRAAELVSEVLAAADANDLTTTAALRLAKTHCGTNPEVMEQVLVLSGLGDRDQFEYMRSLGASALKRSPELEARLLERLATRLGAGDVPGLELLVSAASAFKEAPELLLGALLNGAARFPRGSIANESYPLAAQRLASAVLDKRKGSESRVFEQATAMLTNSDGNSRSCALAVLAEVINHPEKLPGMESVLKAESFWDSIRSIAINEESPGDLRYRAIAMLAKSARQADLELLPKYARATALPLRSAALRAWASTNDATCDDYLLSEVLSSSPQAQQVIIDLIGQKPARLATLADKLSTGAISAKRIGAVELKKLVSRGKDETQRQLSKALDSIVNSDRVKVVADYQACLTLSGDALRGREIFAKHCASCHKVANIGVQVAPDISDSRTQLPTQILTNILDPNRAIDNNYFRYVALTNDDQIFEGIIAEETSDAIVLRGQNNTRHVLSRASLQELKATGTSMMPEGLEAQIDQQAMADVISFIKNWRYLDGSIPQ